MTIENPPTKEKAEQLLDLLQPTLEKDAAEWPLRVAEEAQLPEAKIAPWKEAHERLLKNTGELRQKVVALVQQQFSAEETEILLQFKRSPLLLLVQIWTDIANASSDFLNEDPLLKLAVAQQAAAYTKDNLPEGSEVNVPAEPPADGWQRVDGPQPAAEFIPVAPEEEAEIARMRDEKVPA